MDKKRKHIIEGNAVSGVYDWTLGGYRQKVLVEGKREDLPVVITLHGGPGTPVPFCVGCRGLFPEFTEKFIMVYWDQLGCGINNHVIDDSFTIDLFVRMTADLVAEVKKIFPDSRVYIFAMSWGSILSAKILEKDSRIVDGIVVWGQIVRDVFFNEEVIKTLERSKLSEKKLEAIKAVRKENVSPKEFHLIAASIRKYTSGYQNRAGRQAPAGEMIKGLLTSPDYKLKDIKAIIINGYRKNRSLWNEIICLDLSHLLCGVQIPYSILQGDTDIVTSTAMVSELVKKSGNSNLQCEIIKDSGHLPGSDGMDRAFEKLLRMIETAGK